MKISQDQAKAYAILGVSALAIILIAVSYDKITKGIEDFFGGDKEAEKKKQEEQAKVLQTVDSEIKKRIVAGVKPTYRDALYQTAALNIQNATNKSALDDKNSVAIKELLFYTPKDIDFLKLEEAFGSRPHYWFGVARPSRTLRELISQEFTDFERNQINAMFTKRGLKTKV